MREGKRLEGYTLTSLTQVGEAQSQLSGMAKIRNTGNRKFCAATGTLLLLLVGTQNGKI